MQKTVHDLSLLSISHHRLRLEYARLSPQAASQAAQQHRGLGQKVIQLRRNLIGSRLWWIKRYVLGYRPGDWSQGED